MASDTRNLTKRGAVWFVKRMVRGRVVWKTTGESNLNRARERRDEIISEMKDAALGRSTKTYTVGEWWGHYAKVFSPAKRAPWRDEQCVRSFLESYRHREMRAIRKSDCVSWVNKRKGDAVSPWTVNRERQFLQAMFQRAVEDEVLSKNPWKGIPREECEPRKRVLLPEEEAALRAVMTPRMQRWLTFVLGTGLRIKEACAITPEHIDFERHTLVVPAEAAKFGKSRMVPLSDAVEATIKEQLASTGKLWNAIPQGYRKDLSKACEKAAIEAISPHTLRHTHGTRYMERGGNIFWLTKTMGHSSVEITRRNYVHESDNAHVDAVRQVDVLSAQVPA
jgi:integrase